VPALNPGMCAGEKNRSWHRSDRHATIKNSWRKSARNILAGLARAELA
jgi:hypothetical protein